MRHALMEFAQSRNIQLDNTLRLLPELPDGNIFPGCSTLSYDEVRIIKRRILSNYQTTNIRQSLPSFDHLLQDLGWIPYMVAFETEATVRQLNGDLATAEKLNHMVSLIQEHETFELEETIECIAFLSTGEVLENVTNDLTFLIQVETLSCSYQDLEENRRYINKPRTGFSVVTMM